MLITFLILDADQSSLSSIIYPSRRNRTNSINERFSAARQRLNYEPSHAPSSSFRMSILESTQSHTENRSETPESRRFLTSTPLPETQTGSIFHRISNESIVDVSNFTS